MHQGALGGDRPLSRFFTLSSASLAAQLLPVVSMPLLTRIYGSAEFASPALLSSALAVMSTAACGRLDTSLLLSRDMIEAERRLSLSMMFCAALSTLAAVILAPLVYFGFLGRWAAFLPLLTFLSGSTSSLIAMALVKGAESKAALSNVIRAAAYTIFQVALFPLGGETAMLFSMPLSYAAGLVPLSGFTQTAAKAGIRSEFKTLSGFTVMLLPGAFAAQAAFALPSFVLSRRADDSFLSAWWMASRLLSAPLSVISTPAGQIFSRELSSAPKSERKRVFTFFFVLLGLLAAFISLGMFVVSPLVSMFLGRGWELSGTLLRLSLPLFAIRLVAAPLSNTAVALGRYRAVMTWQIALFISSVLCIFISADVFGYIVLNQATLFILYLMFLLYCRSISAEENP